MRLENIDRLSRPGDAHTNGVSASPRVSHLTRLPRVALPTMSPLARASTAVDISPATRRRVTSHDATRSIRLALESYG